MVDEERPRGVFSHSDREYLELGEETFEEKRTRQAAYKRKQAIPERVRAALLDFEYLADSDRFSDGFLREVRELKSADGETVTGELIRSDGEVTQEPELDPEIEESLVDLVAFAFRVRPGEQYFESLVRAGLKRGLESIHSDAEVDDVNISIEDPDTILDRVGDLMDDGVALTETEYRLAFEYELRPDEEIGEHLRKQGVREERISPERLDELTDRAEKWDRGWAPDDVRTKDDDE